MGAAWDELLDAYGLLPGELSWARFRAEVVAMRPGVGDSSQLRAIFLAILVMF